MSETLVLVDRSFAYSDPFEKRSFERAASILEWELIVSFECVVPRCRCSDCCWACGSTTNYGGITMVNNSLSRVVVGSPIHRRKSKKRWLSETGLKHFHLGIFQRHITGYFKWPHSDGVSEFCRWDIPRKWSHFKWPIKTLELIQWSYYASSPLFFDFASLWLTSAERVKFSSQRHKHCFPRIDLLLLLLSLPVS